MDKQEIHDQFNNKLNNIVQQLADLDAEYEDLLTLRARVISKLDIIIAACKELKLEPQHFEMRWSINSLYLGCKAADKNLLFTAKTAEEFSTHISNFENALNSKANMHARIARVPIADEDLKYLHEQMIFIYFK